MKIKILIVILLAIVSVTGLYSCHKHSEDESRVTSHESRHLYYCPMHPSYTSDKPGQCPICGMNLVPMKEEKPEAKPDKEQTSVSISVERQQLIGVKTAILKKDIAIKEIRTLGGVAFNPDLAVAQTEYIEAKKMGDTGLTRAAKERLFVLGMNDEEIKNLKAVQKNLYLPDKKSWIYPIVYENELPLIKFGQDVNVTLKNGAELKGVVKSVDSIINPVTRSARLHVEVDNGGTKVLPDMFGSAIVKIDLGNKLLIPKSAVISTGERNIAFMVHDGTKFMPVDVKLGAELKDDYVLESGLKEGDTVVTSATFLINSESKLKEAFGVEHKH